MRNTSKRILAVGLPLALVVATGSAIAYWTSNGSGSGTASTADPASSLTVSQVSAPTTMAPGVAPGAVTVSVTNSGTTSVAVSQVVASIASVTPKPGESCSASDYVLSGATMTTGAAELAAGASTTFSGATLGFNNSSTVNQDGCKGATVNLSYVAS